MSSKKRFDEFALMRFSVVDIEQEFAPTLSELLEQLEKFLGTFFLTEAKDEATFAACSEYVGILVCVIDFHNGAAAPSSPATRNERDESKGRFILRAHNKPFCSVVSRLSSSFFLNLRISSSHGRW